MKNSMAKLFIFMTIATLCLGLSACGKEEKTASVSACEVEHIEIETSGRDIVLNQAAGDEIIITATGYNGELYSIEDDTLRIEIPMSKSIVNVGASEVLTVSIPSVSLSSLSINSGAGNTKLESVAVDKITVTAQHGDITISGLDGTLEAVAELGEIKTDTELSGESTELNHGAGQSYSGTIGNSESSQITTLHVKTGDIVIR